MALSATVLQRHENSVLKLAAILRGFTNPFAVHTDYLFDLLTKSVMPENVNHDLRKQSEIGQELLETLSAKRIKISTENLLDPMKKQKLATLRSTIKKTRVLVTKWLS